MIFSSIYELMELQKGGIYKDNPQNRKLGRVGLHWGKEGE